MNGLYGWFNKNLRGRKGQQGFTLIELLVVVTILGILAAIVTLSLVGLTTTANTQACNQEYKTVQTALDAFMADNNLDSVKSVADTNDMTQALTGSGLALWVDLTTSTTQTHNYTRNGRTQFFYSWDTSGKITNIYSDKNQAPAPKGCATT
ncbi:MAG TPA: prepilin-type N-terminal cleavage/methylation domain-containing protein [Candidatus Dormibacteraeota bacterium]|nr:prepilin-type N-terminal cleavage/methylation domain-containing protein [Candidatus Dormibacteraeota bacterium]